MASDSFSITGSIKEIYETETFPSGFKKREFVITTPGQYPQHIKFQLTKDKCDRLNHYRQGHEVALSFNIRGNEKNGKYYTSLEVWKLDPIDDRQQERPQGGSPSRNFPRPGEPESDRLRNPQPAKSRNDDSDGIDF